MKIFGFQKTTLLDYPGHIASIIFTGGCNLRCPYCQNSSLLTPQTFEAADGDRDGAMTGPVTTEEVIDYLDSHRGRLDGLVITGGEPTLQPGLYDFCARVKSLGFLIKLDTNGITPMLLERLVSDAIVDYIALDVKLPSAMYELLLPEHTSDEVKSRTTENLRKSLNILKNLPDTVDCETRTTVTEEFFDKNVMDALGRELSGIKKHYLQPYRDSEGVLIRGLHTPSNEDLIAYRDILLRYVPTVEIRGVDIS